MTMMLKQELDERQLAILNGEMEKRRKSVGTAYVLYLFFGSLGVHKFYIGKTAWGVLYLFMGVVGWLSIFKGGIAGLAENAESAGAFGAFGLLCLALLGILIVIDLFTIPRQVRMQYEDEERRIIESLLYGNF